MSSKPDPVTAAASCCTAVFGLMALPFWYFLLYQILVRVDASTAMWVCYWIYLPLSIIGAVLSQVVKALSESDK